MDGNRSVFRGWWRGFAQNISQFRPHLLLEYAPSPEGGTITMDGICSFGYQQERRTKSWFSAPSGCDKSNRSRDDKTSMDAPMNASFFFARLGTRGQVLSSIRPVRAATEWPLACMEIRGPGPYRVRVLTALCSRTGFPDPVSLTVCPYPSSVLLTSPTNSPAPPLRQPPESGSSPSSSSAPRQCGQSCWPRRGRDQRPRLAHQRVGQSRVRGGAMSGRVPHNGHGASDQQPPQISPAHLQYTFQPWLVSRRVLSRYQAKPIREVRARWTLSIGGARVGNAIAVIVLTPGIFMDLTASSFSRTLEHECASYSSILSSNPATRCTKTQPARG